MTQFFFQPKILLVITVVNKLLFNSISHFSDANSMSTLLEDEALKPSAVV